MLQDAREGADLNVTLKGEAKGQVVAQGVQIATSFTMALDVSGPCQVGDDPLGRALCDVKQGRNVSDADPRVVGDQEESLAVTRQEREFRSRARGLCGSLNRRHPLS